MIMYQKSVACLYLLLFFDAVSNVFTVPTGRGGKDDKHQLQRYVHVNE